MDMEVSYISENKEKTLTHNSTESGPPNQAMFLALAYLPVFDLLAMSQVCRSLRDALNHDILPWLNILVMKPLSSRLSDDFLMKITSKANGRLRTLGLINCEKITDYGLQQVIAKNSHIKKLYVPGCTSLTPEGVIRAVETLTRHNHHLISIHMNGIYNINREHLHLLREIIQPKQKQKQWHNLYHKHKNFSNLKNEQVNCSIDVDICPKCNEVRMIFDCSREKCECRGCFLCIPRCEECGGCITSEELEEAACIDNLCSACWFQLPKCNFCNRPYCSRHANQQRSVLGSLGFVCGSCHEKFIENSCH